MKESSRPALSTPLVDSVDAPDAGVQAQFTDLGGKTVYPAVYFYKDGRGASVDLLDFVRMGALPSSVGCLRGCRRFPARRSWARDVFVSGEQHLAGQ